MSEISSSDTSLWHARGVGILHAGPVREVGKGPECEVSASVNIRLCIRIPVFAGLGERIVLILPGIESKDSFSLFGGKDRAEGKPLGKKHAYGLYTEYRNIYPELFGGTFLPR